MTVGVDDNGSGGAGGGGGSGGGGNGNEVSNNIQGRYKHRKSCEAEYFRLDKIRDVDALNQSGSQEKSISGSKDEVIR